MSKNFSLNEVQKAVPFDIRWKKCIYVLSACTAGICVISAALLINWLGDQCMNVITFQGLNQLYSKQKIKCSDALLMN